MGNGASVKPECFAAMKEEYEKSKANMTDEQLFIHMKVFHDNFINQKGLNNITVLMHLQYVIQLRIVNRWYIASNFMWSFRCWKK